MKKMISVIITFLSLQSASAEPMMYDNVDISPMVDHLKAYAVPLEQSITIFNWSNMNGIKEEDTKGLAEYWGKLFWKQYGTQEKAGNMYGGGLYGAVDPVATFGYGGGLTTFVLLEMKLPKGFLLVDLNGGGNNETYKPTEEYKRVAKAFNCPEHGNPNQFFSSGGISLEPKCRDVVRKIYQDILKIDGIVYPYGDTAFNDCSPGRNLGHKAMVILSTKWMKPELLHYYTPRTTDRIEDRIRIQTLFLKAGSDQFRLNGNVVLGPIGDYLTAHPDTNLKGSTTKCEGDSCVITVQFCDSQNKCENVDLPALPRPGGPLITLVEAVKNPAGGGAYGLLWPDLEGKPKSTTVSTWLKENKYACTGQIPHKAKQ